MSPAARPVPAASHRTAMAMPAVITALTMPPTGPASITITLRASKNRPGAGITGRCMLTSATKPKTTPTATCQTSGHRASDGARTASSTAERTRNDALSTNGRK